jgi:hypothetical protein
MISCTMTGEDDVMAHKEYLEEFIKAWDIAFPRGQEKMIQP